jgi:ATP-dependent Clp protease adaptor protein ClpS
MIRNSDTCTETLVEVAEEVDLTQNVILYNDEVNTFDFVIETLVKVCKHDPVQAEQCTYLVHYTGKCAVKSGTFSELKPVCEALSDRGLTASIE